jgi:hypothetical protein
MRQKSTKVKEKMTGKRSAVSMPAEVIWPKIPPEPAK